MDEGQRAQTRGDGLPPGVPAEAVKPPGMLRPQYTDYWITGGEVGRWPVWTVVTYFGMQGAIAALTLWGDTKLYGWEMLRPHPDRTWFALVIFHSIVALCVPFGVFKARPVYRRSGDLRLARYVFFMALATSMAVAGACWFWLWVLLGHGMVSKGFAGILVLFASLAFACAFVRPPREGTTLRCARCGYPFDNADDYVCSECGRGWLGSSGLVRGDKVRPKPLHYGVLGVCVLPIVATGLLFAFSGVYRFAPTERLVAQAMRAPVQQFGGPWGELERRQLSAEQITRLAERLIGREGDQTPLMPDARGWLQGRLFAGELPEPLIERVLERMVVPTLEVPREARVGEAFAVRVYANAVEIDRHRLFNAQIAMRGTDVLGSQQSGWRSNRFVPFWPLVSARHAPDPIWTQSYTFDSPGEAEITVDLWIFARSSPGSGQVQWRPDGTPEPPQGAYGVVRRSLTGTVRVRPAEEP